MLNVDHIQLGDIISLVCPIHLALEIRQEQSVRIPHRVSRLHIDRVPDSQVARQCRERPQVYQLRRGLHRTESPWHSCGHRGLLVLHGSPESLLRDLRSMDVFIVIAYSNFFA